MMMMVMLGYGGDKMAWGDTKIAFGTCGNFKFEFHDLTDVKATRSLIRPTTVHNKVHFVASTNETDGADVFGAQTLAWTGTCDSDTANEIVDSSETFDTMLNNTVAYNVETGDANLGKGAHIVYKDADELYCFALGDKTAYDLCPTGDEDYRIDDQKIVQVVAGTANDDGTLLIMG